MIDIPGIILRIYKEEKERRQEQVLEDHYLSDEYKVIAKWLADILVYGEKASKEDQ